MKSCCNSRVQAGGLIEWNVGGREVAADCVSRGRSPLFYREDSRWTPAHATQRARHVQKFRSDFGTFQHATIRPSTPLFPSRQILPPPPTRPGWMGQLRDLQQQRRCSDSSEHRPPTP